MQVQYNDMNHKFSFKRGDEWVVIEKVEQCFFSLPNFAKMNNGKKQLKKNPIHRFFKTWVSAFVGEDIIVFRFTIEYSSLRDFGPKAILELYNTSFLKKHIHIVDSWPIPTKT
jgi:hypothetical protein